MKNTSRILIFVLGMAAGAAAMRLCWFALPPHPPRPEQIARRLSHDLSLDDSQRTELERIFAAHGVKIAAFQKDTRERFDALREENDAQISKILKPEQQRTFDELRRKWRERFAEAAQRSPGRMPPPPFP